MLLFAAADYFASGLAVCFCVGVVARCLCVNFTAVLVFRWIGVAWMLCFGSIFGVLIDC